MPDEPGKDSPKSLASILARVLDWVQLHEYADFGEYMVFGVSFSEEVPEAFTTRKREADEGLKVIDRYISAVRVGRRTSLTKDEDFARRLDKAGLSDRGREVVRVILGGLDPSEMKLAKGGLEDPTTVGVIEEHFARELVGKLPKIVKRASSLDEINDEEIDKGLVPDQVRKYWQEAHGCYVYGFPIACAVLCRAILESALVETIDPERQIDQMLTDQARKSGKPKESYIERLVKEAAKRHILTDDRPRCAIEVRNAGNDAIHDYNEFEKRLGDPLRGVAYIVDSTRKVLIDLYSGGG
jgi:hypothetical protein